MDDEKPYLIGGCIPAESRAVPADPDLLLEQLSRQLDQLDRGQRFAIHPLILGRTQGFVAGVGLAVITLMLEHLFGV